MKKLIGDKAFYLKVFKVAFPMMVQMSITNFVGLLDNLMVGQLGTEEMTGVAVVNQILFVFNLCVFGALSGAGIYGSQFYGKKDTAGLQYVMRFKLIASMIVTGLALVLLYFAAEPLVGLFLTEGSEGDVQSTLEYGKTYLFYMLFTLIPFAVKECYASSLKEVERTVLPMVGSGVAVIVNFALNYVLIFGKFGAPELGVTGAAIATLIARFIELIIVAFGAHLKKNNFFNGVYRSFYIPKELIKGLLVKGFPLLLNETLWSGGIATLNQCYSMRGLQVMTAINMASTISNLFNVVFISMGSATAILVGQELGAERYEGAKDTARKMTAFSVAICGVIGVLMALIAPGFTTFYNTSDSIRGLACVFIYVAAFIMPFDAFNQAAYFILRSGGKTFITFLFDSLFFWYASIPVAQLLVRGTDFPIEAIYAICYGLNLLKCVVGFVLLKKGIWVQSIVKRQ